MYRSLTLCYPACGHHRKTLSIRLLAVGFNNLDVRSGLLRPAPLQTCCIYAAGLQRSRWYRHGFREPVLVSGTRMGSRAVATANMAGYCTGTCAHAWYRHGNPCWLSRYWQHTGSRVLASAY